ncbi:uncharacterized protein CCR75_003096 [Bremia lactucae]|uniref:Poly(A) RNA polymerase mitochondrial-like central palm domain-containing protein n=1 Tax=Bremia lactucae TaxID=4779 RepID=A0A976NZ83_BRELC|nr:hypothetical protein CCR75_003096 [Bremia lactucae]
MRHRRRSAKVASIHVLDTEPAHYNTHRSQLQIVRSTRPRRIKHTRDELAQSVCPTNNCNVRCYKCYHGTLDGGTSKETICTMAMDTELTALAAKVALSQQEKLLRTKAFEDVRELVTSAFQSATVQLFGSFSTGVDTFRSDLDVTVGISMSSSRPMPSEVMVDREYCSDEQRGRCPESGSASVHDTVQKSEDKCSFSLNLALPLGVIASQDNMNISRRVQRTTASHWNPTLRRRKIRTLRALQLLLKLKRPFFHVKCLHKAKVPILMVFDTKTKLSIDIGINSGSFEASDNGSSTILIQRLQRAYGKPFTTITIFLKEFLHQFDLNKPFTGGLGSYRLYIMVAYIFQRNDPKQRRCRQQPISSLLLLFFEVFGNKKQSNFLHEGTQLQLPLGVGGFVDFRGIFRINECVVMFAMAYDIVSSTRKISSIIYEERIAQDRKKCQINNEFQG